MDMKINIGMSKKSGAPEGRNSRSGVLKISSVGAGGSMPTGNMGKGKATGKPGSRNARNGTVVNPNVFEGKDYGGMKMRADKAVMNKTAKGNPGSKNARGGNINKNPMLQRTGK